jgi:hypothetical protein
MAHAAIHDGTALALTERRALRVVGVPPYGRESHFLVASWLQRALKCPAGPFPYVLVSKRNDARGEVATPCCARRLMHREIPRIYIMKSTYLTPLACAALLFGCAIANAQTPNTPSDQPSTAPVSNQADTSKGNTLVGATPTDQTATESTAGQDKSSGNDMVNPKADAAHSGTKLASAARPDFNTLDTTKKGNLSADDVKGDAWLTQNFTRCDSNHDGKLSRAEYAACK